MHAALQIATPPAAIAEFAQRCARQQVISCDIAEAEPAARYLIRELAAEVPGRIVLFEHDRGSGAIAGTGVLDPLPWDSAVYGMQMGKLSWLLAAGEAAQRRRTREQLAAEAVEEARRRRYRHLSARTPASDHETVHALEAAGFRSMGIQITLARGRPQSPPPPCPDGIVISHFVPGDLPAILDFSTDAYRESRLFVDPDLPAEPTGRLYRKWVENDCSGRAAATFVARWNAMPVGYITCLLHPAAAAYGIPACGDIDLITVSPAARGRGVALALVGTSLAWFAEHTARVIVKTQVTNYRAIALYQRAGFVLEQAFADLHRVISD